MGWTIPNLALSEVTSPNQILLVNIGADLPNADAPIDGRLMGAVHQ